jgi:hypothetical protein
VGGSLGVAIDYFKQSYSAMAAALAFLISMMLFAAYLGGIRVYDDTDSRVKQGAFTPIVVDFMYKRRVAEVFLDFCLAALCYYTAYRLRFEDPEEFMKNFGTFRVSLPVILASQMMAFFVVGVYRGVWRHFGMMDSLVIARGVLFGTIGAQVFILYVYHYFAYSRTVFAIYGVLLLMAATLARASFRIVGEFAQRQRQSGRRVVIYGAGDAGGLVIREVLSGDGDVRILGFIDDDPRKAGIRVMGYSVLGGYSALSVLIRAASVDAVVVSAAPCPRAPQQPRGSVLDLWHPPGTPPRRPRADCRRGAPCRIPVSFASYRHVAGSFLRSARDHRVPQGTPAPFVPVHDADRPEHRCGVADDSAVVPLAAPVFPDCARHLLDHLDPYRRHAAGRRPRARIQLSQKPRGGTWGGGGRRLGRRRGEPTGGRPGGRRAHDAKHPARPRGGACREADQRPVGRGVGRRAATRSATQA